MPIVFVEITPPDISPALSRALLDSCSTAIHDGQCELAGGASEESPNLVAIVSWDDKDTNVQVRVGSRASDASLWRARSLRFLPVDALTERWKAAGLTVATLADAVVAAPAATASLPSPGPAPPVAPVTQDAPDAPRDFAGRVVPPGVAPGTPLPDRAANAGPPTPTDDREPQENRKPTSSDAYRTLWVSAGPAGRTGFDGGNLAWGAWLDAGWRPLSLPVFGRFELGYSVAPSNDRGVSVQWTAATLGVGVSLPVVHVVSFEPRVAAGIQSIHASVTEALTGRSDSGGQIDFSFGAGADVVGHLGRFGVLGGMDVVWSRAPTDIFVQNRDAGTLPSSGWSAHLGGRFYFD